MELRVGQGYGKVSWAVRTIWENYVGWFKFASTTELSPDSADAARPVLIEAHRYLLDHGGSESFWEHGWLVDRINRLEAGADD